MLRRKQLLEVPTKAHDWQKFGFDQRLISWKCSKCGAIILYQSHKPNRYARFEPLWISSEFPHMAVTPQLVYRPHGPGMLCDEAITWKVMES